MTLALKALLQSAEQEIEDAADVLGISSDALATGGDSYSVFSAFDPEGRLVATGIDLDAGQALERWTSFRASAPHTPEAALQVFSIAYCQVQAVRIALEQFQVIPGEVAFSDPPEDKEPREVGEFHMMATLLWASVQIGMARGYLAATHQGVDAEAQRRAMLVHSGRMGAERKHSETRAFKAWAIDKAEGRSDKRMARQLMGMIPPEFAHVVARLQDPEGVIYMALRAARSPQGE